MEISKVLLEAMFMGEWRMELTANILKNSNKFRCNIKLAVLLVTTLVKSHIFQK